MKYYLVRFWFTHYFEEHDRREEVLEFLLVYAHDYERACERIKSIPKYNQFGGAHGFENLTLEPEYYQ